AFIAVSGCQNPMKSIETDIANFKKQSPQQFTSYKTKHRQMQVAWAGDPTKRPLIFVHGSPGSWEAWAAFLMNKDLHKKYHLLAVDRPGYEGSTYGRTEPSLAKQAADIIEVLQFNQSGLPAILIGHSYGGPVIAKIAMDFSQKVGGLIFVASSVSPDLEKIKWIQNAATWWPFRALIPSALRVCNEEIMALKDQLNLILPDWKNIHARTVLIQGDQDDLVPKENQFFLQEHIRKDLIIKSTMIPAMNHFIPWRRPDLILQGISLLDEKN
ncbi:MAG: alpha/beta fold hydrolase, partial [Pseudobdellovibrionaceae bacterium]